LALENAKILLTNLNWRFHNISLYELALTHSSYANEENSELEHNERLEFLGDAVLDLIISDYLYRHYAHFPEGDLSKIRADLVCEDCLAQLAIQLNLGKYLYLGKGEAFYGGNSKPSLLADALEAIVAALYLDLGYEECYRKVVDLFEPVFRTIDVNYTSRDFKTLLQEYTQSHFGEIPTYKIIKESGPDHQKEFVAQVYLEGKIKETGAGSSKKQAEQSAAKRAWDKLSQKLID